MILEDEMGCMYAVRTLSESEYRTTIGPDPWEKTLSVVSAFVRPGGKARGQT